MPRCNTIGWSACLAAVLVAVCGCTGHIPQGAAPDHALAMKLRKTLGGTQGGEGTTAAGDSADSGPVGTGWATVRGKFTLDGTAPQRRPISITKNPEVCAPGGKPVLSESLLVDESTKGIANVAVYLRKASRVHESAQPSAKPKVFDQKQCVFLSHVFPVAVDQEIDIKNSDPIGHNTNVSNTGFNSLIAAGTSLPLTFKKELALPTKVTCNIHPWMEAYMLPRDNGYVAITAPDGTFEIKNLPAGEELEFQVWHEDAAGPNGVLQLSTPEAKAVNWSSKGRFKIKLEPDEERELDFAVPLSSFNG